MKLSKYTGKVVLKSRLKLEFPAMCNLCITLFCVFACIASRKGLEEQIEKLKAEKKSVSAELLMSEERFGTLQNELEHMKHENKTLFESKAEIEVHSVYTHNVGLMKITYGVSLTTPCMCITVLCFMNSEVADAVKCRHIVFTYLLSFFPPPAASCISWVHSPKTLAPVGSKF